MKKKYDLTYNFGIYQEAVKSLLEKLKENSIQLFGKQILAGKILRNNATYKSPQFYESPQLKREMEKVMDFIKNTEEYLHYYYLKDRKNFDFIFKAISKLEAISVLDDNDRGIYGVTNNNTIQISPNLSGNKYLTPEQRTRLYVAHELGHIVNKQWMMKVTEYLRSEGNSFDKDQRQLICDGFSLINEATTQDRAEDIAYFFAKKQRPVIKSFVDARGIYGGEKYKSNFDFYGELQEPAIIFARTLRGIGKLDNDNEVLSTLSKRALNPNFVNNIINEYKRDGQISNLYREFQYLGSIKNASYARFGRGEQSYLKSSKDSLNKFKAIANSLRDYREPFEVVL